MSSSGWLFSGSKFQAIDSNGVPLSGGLLYAYECGTTTPKSTYPTEADAIALTNENTWPVVLNSRGEADIFVNDCVKFVLKTATGVTIWTVDNLELESNLTVTTYMETVLAAASATVASQLLELEKGIDVQEYDDDLELLAGLTVAANQFIARASSGAVGVKSITDRALSILAASTPEAIQSLIGLTGTIIAWPTGSLPAGYLECDGASLDRTTYDVLFAVLGTTYGFADATHFYLPDYRGRFLRGWAHGQTTDPDKATRTDRGDGTGGDVVGSKQADEQEAHDHGAQTPVITASATLARNPATGSENYDGVAIEASNGVGDEDRTWVSGYTQVTATQAAHTHASVGGNETRPINTNVMFIIKY